MIEDQWREILSVMAMLRQPLRATAPQPESFFEELY